jgi:hypothetical protein
VKEREVAEDVDEVVAPFVHFGDPGFRLLPFTACLSIMRGLSRRAVERKQALAQVLILLIHDAMRNYA